MSGIKQVWSLLQVEYLLNTGNLVSNSTLDLSQNTGFTVVAEKLNFFRCVSDRDKSDIWKQTSPTCCGGNLLPMTAHTATPLLSFISVVALSLPLSMGVLNINPASSQCARSCAALLSALICLALP